MDFFKLAVDEAKKSPCKKRKVGAVIVHKNTAVVSTGYNYPIFSDTCEDKFGNTYDDVRHAEIEALSNLDRAIMESPIGSLDPNDLTIYVTHQPCDNCAKAIHNAGITKIVLVTEFLKFDTGKLRYSLIPPEMTKSLAEVLTYGAKKYKPNNWQQVDDKSRYEDALYRHLEAYRSGEQVDPESGLHHLAHAMTNVGFLLWLDLNNKLDKNNFDLNNPKD